MILTGTVSDGALGIRAIKENNGRTIAQDPADSEYDGMPRGAIATGMVDLVLPVDAIPAALQRFASTDPNVRIPRDGEEAGE